MLYTQNLFNNCTIYMYSISTIKCKQNQHILFYITLFKTGHSQNLPKKFVMIYNKTIIKQKQEQIIEQNIIN